MGRKRKFAYGNGTRKRKRIRSEEKGSEGSDEDYVIGEDESDEDNSEEYCASSSHRDLSEGSFDLGTSCSSGSSDGGRKVVRSKPRKGFAPRAKLGSKRRKRGVSRVLVDSDGEDDNEDEEFIPDADDCLDDDEESLAMSCRSSSSDEGRKAVQSKPRKGFAPRGKLGSKRRKCGVSRVLVDSDVVDEDDDEDEDEDFMPDADDCLDDEEESRVRRKSEVQNRAIRRKGSSKRRKTKRKSKKKEKKKALSERRGRSGLKKVISSDDDFVVEDRVAKEKSRRKKVRGRSKRAIVHSDSDFVDSGSSDFEYTVSEEERDFIRELANNGNLTSCLGRSSLSKRLQINGASLVQQQGTNTRRGKEKVDDLQLDMGKQVCGICLSEEQKGTVRGTLNSCFHYFCFTCIMEWSKVESRCPVCKQRFTTISKQATSDAGIGLRKAVIRVPRRDQVYRPSEEEMRGYLDPYENVVCMECQQGGDDSLMLLCDICDSPAHTYCVGLGREVPDGNWYCEGCKSDPVSTNPRVQNSAPDQNTGNSGLCFEHSTGGIDAENFETDRPPFSSSQHPGSFSEQIFSPGIDLLASPRRAVGEDIQVASPRSGVGPSTVLERRRLRRRIHNLISTYRMSQFTERDERTNGLPHASLASDVISEIEQNRVTVENAKSIGSGDSHSVAVEGMVQGVERSCSESLFCSVQNGDTFSERASSRKQLIHDLNATPSNVPVDDILSAEQVVTNSLYRVLGHEQHSQPTIGSSTHIFPCTYSEGCSSPTAEEAKERVRAMVKRHLKHLSRDTELEHWAFKDIARHSTHTILAACGYKHSSSMAIPVQPPSGCFHIEKEGRQLGLMKALCSSCFDSFVKDVVLRLMKLKLQQ